jgi:hypothetical protein
MSQSRKQLERNTARAVITAGGAATNYLPPAARVGEPACPASSAAASVRSVPDAHSAHVGQQLPREFKNTTTATNVARTPTPSVITR